MFNFLLLNSFSSVEGFSGGREEISEEDIQSARDTVERLKSFAEFHENNIDLSSKSQANVNSYNKYLEAKQILESLEEKTEQELTIPSRDNLRQKISELFEKHQETGELSQDDINSLLDLKQTLDSIEGERNEILLETRSKLNQLLESTTQTVDGVETDETFSEGDSNLGRGASNRFEIISNLHNASRESIGNILKSSNLQEISNELQNFLQRNGSSISYTRTAIGEDGQPMIENRNVGPRSRDNNQVTRKTSLGEAERLLKSFGYKKKSISFNRDREYMAVFQTIIDTANIQSEMDTLDDIQKVKLLIDMDRNGVLETDNGELSKLIHIDSPIYSDGNSFDNLVKNLGLGDSEELFTQMGENFYSARDRFQTALRRKLDMGFNITELTMPNGVREASQEMSQEVLRIETHLHQEIDRHLVAMIDDNLDFASTTLSPEQKTNLKNEFKKNLDLRSVSISYINGVGSLGANFDISDLTQDFLDTFRFGITDNGNIGISVGKNLFSEFLEKYGTTLTAGLTSGLNPFLSARQQIGNGTVFVGVSPIGLSYGGNQSVGGQVDVNELNQMKTDPSIRGTVYGSSNGVLDIVGVNFSNIDEDTVSGIEQMVNRNKELLYNVVDLILSGETSYDGTSEEQEIYTQMKEYFELATQLMTPEEKDIYKDVFVNGYSTHYRNELYKNAEGFKMTTVGLGVMFMKCFFPLPFVVLGGEYISTKMHETNRNLERQERVTQNQIPLEKLDSGIEDYNGIEVFNITSTFESRYLQNGIGRLQISQSDESSAQIKIENGQILVGGTNIDNISIVEYTKSGEYHRVLVVDGGYRDEDGRPIEKYNSSEITNSLSRSEIGLTGLEINETPKLLELRNSLTSIIANDALPHSQTIGMTKLQKMIFEFKNTGTPDLEQVWNQFKKVINHDNGVTSFRNYALEKGMESEDFNNLKNLVDYEYNSNQKIHILQTLTTSLTSRGQISLESERGYLEGGKTINEYNTQRHRDTFFDNLMSQELPNVSNNITEARNEWNSRHGEKTEFTTYTSESFGLSGTQVGSGRNSQTGLSPLDRGYRLIGESAQDALVEINGLNKEQKLAILEKMPIHILESYKAQLEVLGKTFYDLDLLKEFIANSGDNELRLDMNVFFGKNAECINDAIVVDLVPRVIGAGGMTSSYVQENDHIGLMGTIADDWKERYPEPDEDEEENKEKEDDSGLPTSNPDEDVVDEINEEGTNITEENNEIGVSIPQDIDLGNTNSGNTNPGRPGRR